MSETKPHSTASSPTNPQVLILGGGVAGAAAALALARAGTAVTVIEAEPVTPWKIGETLGPEARPWLMSLGVWEDFVKAGHLPCYGHVSAWGWSGVAEKDFIFNPHGHAWQLDRAVFETGLLTAAEAAGARIARGIAVDRLDRQDGLWHCQRGSETLTAPWLIDATGRRAWVARSTGIKRTALDQLVALFCQAVLPEDPASTAGSQDSRTWIESCEHGWWYSALTPGGRTFAFLTDADLIQGQDWRTPAWFASRLEQTRHVSKLRVSHPWHFPTAPQLTSAHTGRLEQVSGDGWLAVGDAAMSFDPLSGQGLAKALLSGLQAARTCQDPNPTPESQAAFDQWNQQTWDQFSAQRLHHYALENRWPAAPFWQRRREA